MTPVGLSPTHLWVVSICALNLAGVTETHVRALFVVVPPPAFDPDLGLRPVPKPLEGRCFRYQLLLRRPQSSSPAGAVGNRPCTAHAIAPMRINTNKDGG